MCIYIYFHALSFTQVVALDDAKAINGLRAVFGEQYPDPVRVVSVGGPGVQVHRIYCIYICVYVYI